MDDLEQALAGWDGKSTADLGRIYTRFRGEAYFVNDLLLMTADPRRQVAATWLLKRFVELCMS